MSTTLHSTTKQQLQANLPNETTTTQTSSVLGPEVTCTTGNQGQMLHHLNQTTSSSSNVAAVAAQRQAIETLEELDWCLDQLEAIDAHKSVGDMASTKFRRMLNKELSHVSESRSGNQIKGYIKSFFGEYLSRYINNNSYNNSNQS